jgi:putative aminopeptidase FrvX
VDVGTQSEAESRALGLDVLQPLRLARPSLTAMGDLMISRALDNRLGSYALLRLARQLANERFDEGEVILAWTSQEEIGFRGTKALARQLRKTGGLDAAISIDAYPVKREPGLRFQERGAQPGAGPVIRGADLEGVAARQLCEYVISAAGRAGVPVQHVYADGNNQASVFTSTPWCAIDYPMTYMHSNAESVHRADLDAMHKLVTQIVLDVGTLTRVESRGKEE